LHKSPSKAISPLFVTEQEETEEIKQLLASGYEAKGRIKFRDGKKKRSTE